MNGYFGTSRAAGFAAVTVTAAATALLLAGCGSSSIRSAVPGPVLFTPPTGGAAGHAQTATQDADSLLAAFTAPTGATRLSAAPAAAPLLAGSTPPETPVDPDLVERTAWWSTTQAPATLLAWLTAHPAAGTALDGSSTSNPAAPASAGSPASTGAADLWTRDFAAPAVPEVISQRLLEAAVTALPYGGSALRVDAIVTYLPAKPAGETIPIAAMLEVTPTLPSVPSSGNAAGVSPVAVTDPVQIAEITSLVNGLPTMTDGAVNCPMDDGAGIRIDFRSASGTELAQAVIAATGCRTVAVTVGGAAQPALSGGDQLSGQIMAVLGAHWRLTSA